MFDPKIFNELTNDFMSHLPPGFSAFRADFEQHFKQFMQRLFASLDLVTREEFDAQAALLAKTRLQLEALEDKLKSKERA